MPPIDKPRVYVEKTFHVAAEQIHLVDERFQRSLQTMCLEDARNDIFQRSNNRIRGRWQRTTVHTPADWMGEDQPYMGHDARICKGYVQHVHIYKDTDKNCRNRKPLGTSTNADSIDAGVGHVIMRLLRALGFDLCMVHHLDFGDCFFMETYGDGNYHIYYHKVGSDNLYWLYSTRL